MLRPDVYISTDVETDGPIPGPHSLLSLGSVAINEQGSVLSDFTANLESLEGATADPATLAWWSTQPEAWEECRRDLEEPSSAMTRYAAWLRGLPGVPVFVGYPAAFDFAFVNWYLIRFTGQSPFAHAALDLKTMAMCLLGCRFREATKRRMPRRWFSERRHRHVALDDAREQGHLFTSMMRELRRARPK